MARCKCRICGEPHNTNDAYKVVVNNKNQYYCSQEEYEKDLAEKKKAAEDKDRVYYLICDILGEEEIINTALWAEKKVWNKAFSDEFIAKYLQENKDYLTIAITRLDASQFAKIRYLSTVLKNGLGDFKPKVDAVEQPKIVVEETIYDAPTHTLNKRRSLEDLEDMF